MSDKPASDKPMKIATLLERLLAYIQRQWRLLALVTLYIFFRPTFEGYIASLLESFEPSVGSFVIWLLLIVFALVYTYILSRRRYVLSEGLRAWTVVVLGGWAYYRFVGTTHYVATSTLILWACYIDIFLILCVCVAFIAGWSHWMRRKSKKEVADNSREGYHVEHTCTSEDEDLLGRREEAEALAEKLFQTDTSRGVFTLGLTAPWGAGKTSFMLVMKEYLEKQHDEKTIVIEFNPWRYRKAPNLTQIFFEELSHALAPYNSALSTGLVRYVDLLLAKDSNPWLQLASRFLPHEFNAKSTGEQYDFLTREISKLGRKIFIFIDDVDRLEREELVELFALVRNSSSFPSMSYILAYDKEYVASQLKGYYDQHTYRYMEKIVQEEYVLAQITPEQIERALKLELEDIGYGTLFAAIEESQILLSYHLPTLRAVKRICNTLSSCRRALEGNVAIFDWFIIELIRTQYPRLFDFLRANYERAFDSRGDKRLFKTTEEKKDEQGWTKKALPGHPKYGGLVYFSSYLSEHQEYFQIKDVGLVIELMMVLWGETREAKPLQVNHGDYIGRYFYRTLREIEIDEAEFRAHIALPLEELKPYIRSKAVSHQFTDLVRKIRREPIESQEQARKILQVLFYLYSDLNRVFGWGEITNKVDALSKYLMEGDLKSELKEIFEYPDTRVGILRFLSAITRDEDDIMIPFMQDELEVIKEKLFLDYVEESNPVDPVICYRLWRLAQTNIQVNSNGQRVRQSKRVVCHPQMDLKMKVIIEGSVECIIPYMIDQSAYNRDKYSLLCPYPIWSLDEEEKHPAIGYFPDFIRGLDGDASPIIKEFKKFAQKWQEVGGLVPFEFKDIQPKDIWSVSTSRGDSPIEL